MTEKKKSTKPWIISTLILAGIIAITAITLFSTRDKGGIIKLGNWEIEIGGARAVNELSSYDWTKDEPKSGSYYIAIETKIKNIHTESSTFDTVSGRSSTPKITLLYKNKYTFKAERTSAYKDNIYGKELTPLQTINGDLVFEVPEEVVNEKQTKIRIEYDGKIITRKLRLN